MKYMGSKARVAKHILPIILKDREEGQWYVEPFVGGANLIDKVNGLRIGNDINKYVIAVHSAIQNGWIPPDTLTEIEYKSIRRNSENYPDYIVGFAAICCSFAGKWWGGYARGYSNYGVQRNYAKEQKQHLLKQSKPLLGVRWHCESYLTLEIPPRSIIYCDPPYRNTTKYSSTFDHEHFYCWCRDRHAEGHTIFISEYQMPDDFICVWSKRQTSSLTKDTGSKVATEKLFTL